MYCRTWVICLIVLLLLSARGASAARLAFVFGTVVQPNAANEGDELAPGTQVEAGSDALLIIEHRWRSDVATRDCVHLVIFGYGQSYTVEQAGTPGRCDVKVPSNPGRPAQGRAFLNRETRYGDAKFDEPAVPPHVAASEAGWRAFDSWLQSAQRSFNGTVTLVSGNTIRVRSSSSAQQRTFGITPSTESAVAIKDLLNTRVRVDYQGARTARAVRIRTAVPDARPPDRPPGGERQRPPPRADAEHWLCTVDLHQGDTGTLRLERIGTGLRGTLAVRDGSVSTVISGTWEADRLTFQRDLSGGTAQPFAGIAVTALGGRLRLAGRFAYDHAGVWSADCQRQ